MKPSYEDLWWLWLKEKQLSYEEWKKEIECYDARSKQLSIDDVIGTLTTPVKCSH